MNNVTNSLPQTHAKVKRQPADKLNLARSKGEYAPKWTQKSASAILEKQAPAVRDLADEMLWA